VTEYGVKLRIECHHLMGNRARVWIDDEEKTGSISRVELAWDASDFNRATVTYLVRELEVESIVETGGGRSAPPVHPLKP
jgi:hypothetical protein